MTRFTPADNATVPYSDRKLERARNSAPKLSHELLVMINQMACAGKTPSEIIAEVAQKRNVRLQASQVVQALMADEDRPRVKQRQTQAGAAYRNIKGPR